MKKTDSKSNFFLFFVLTDIFKKWHMVAENKHPIRKEMAQNDGVWVFQAIHRFLLEK